MTGRVALLFACTAAIALSQGRPALRLIPTCRPLAVGSPYVTTLSARGGDGLLTWQITAGTLPPDFRLSV